MFVYGFGKYYVSYTHYIGAKCFLADGLSGESSERFSGMLGTDDAKEQMISSLVVYMT